MKNNPNPTINRKHQNNTGTFGTGSTAIRTVQDLSLYSGVPPLVRSGDYFGATFTLRNGTDHPMTVTAKVDLQPAVASGGPLTVTIPAGGAVPVTWRLTAPQGIDKFDAIPLHHKIDRVSFRCATKAVKKLPLLINVKRRCLFLMKRT